MTIIKDRYEFGREVNFGNNPVVYIDATNKDEYGIKGAFVRVDMGEFKSGEKWLTGCQFRFYMERDGRTHTVVSPKIAAITNWFGYNEVMECAKYATTPIIKTGDEVVFIIANPNRKAVAAEYPAAAKIRKVCGGWMVFDTIADYEIWRKQK